MVNQASTRFKGDTHPAQCQNQQCQKRRVWKRSRKTVNLKLSRRIRDREGGREGGEKVDRVRVGRGEMRCQNTYHGRRV